MQIKKKWRSIWQLIRVIGNRSETWLDIKGVFQRGRAYLWILWNNFRKMFNIKLQKLWIYSTWYHQKIQGIRRSVCALQTRPKVKTGCKGSTALKTDMILYWTPLPGHHLCNPKMQVKAVSCKEEAICEHDPETPPSSLNHEMIKCLNFNIWNLVYAIVGIKYGFKRFENHCILLSFMFYTTPPTSFGIVVLHEKCWCTKKKHWWKNKIPLQVADHELLDAGVRWFNGLAKLFKALKCKCNSHR